MTPEHIMDQHIGVKYDEVVKGFTQRKNIG